MNEELEKLSPSRRTAAKTLFAALKILKKAGGQLPGKEVVEQIEKTEKLTEEEKARYEKTGYIRWQSILHFYTIDATKAGYLRKQTGNWILTEEGDKAIESGPVKLLESVQAAYRKWKEGQPLKAKEEDLEDDSEQTQKANLELIEEQAMQGLRNYILSKNPYEFQDLVASLLHAMGYYTPVISPRGKDSGVDIIAFRDPLGAEAPRIKVQVKHKPDTAIPVSDIRGLTGLLNKTDDVGIFVTSGHFSSDAEKFARESHQQINLIDFGKFIRLWEEYYDKLSDEEKNMLPLYRISFLGTKE